MRVDHNNNFPEYGSPETGRGRVTDLLRALRARVVASLEISGGVRERGERLQSRVVN